MITESQVYWIVQCDHLRETMDCLAVGGGISAGVIAAVCAIVGMVMLDADDNPCPNLAWGIRRFFIPAIIVAIIGLLGKTFIPTTKEMALIKVAPALANSELVQTTIPNEAKEIYGLAKTALVEKLKGETK